MNHSMHRQVLECASPLVLWRFGTGWRQSKAAEDCRTPRRCRARTSAILRDSYADLPGGPILAVRKVAKLEMA